MAGFVLSGSDTLSLNNRVLQDFSTGTYAEITYANNIADVKTGKNGNSIFGFNATGSQAELKIKLLRGSSDDKFLNQQLNLQNNNFAGFTLLIGEMVKKLGDGQGNITSDTYLLSGGVFTKRVDAKSDAEGATDQSEVLYTLMFTLAPRSIR